MAVISGVSVFAGEPQPVEIHHRGIWYSGELLGWRHDGEGRAVARVRCVVDGLRHSTWKDLGELRLPDPKHPPRAEAFPAAPALPADRNGLPEDDDETRPHILMGVKPNRPQKPEHARTPPAGPAEPNRAAVPPTVRPVERIPAPASYSEARPERRRLLPDREPAALTGV
jgi:hypothetical protein